jgi:hypothetical protein
VQYGLFRPIFWGRIFRTGLTILGKAQETGEKPASTENSRISWIVMECRGT